MNELETLKQALTSLPAYDWRSYDMTVSKRLWQVSLEKTDWGYDLYFVSPDHREYSFVIDVNSGASGASDAKLTVAEIRTSNGKLLDKYDEYHTWQDLDRVIQNTPRYIFDKMLLVLDALRY